MATAVHDLWFAGQVKSLVGEEWQWQNKQPKSHDLLWSDYFKDPSQWLDERKTKAGYAYPDFKHKITGQPLWIDGSSDPAWVVEELKRRGLAHDAEFCRTATYDQRLAFVVSLRACARNKDLCKGTRLHAIIAKWRLLEKCSDALVIMYASCDALTKAEGLLHMHSRKSVFAWTSLIAGFARQGKGQDALRCFDQMQNEGLAPDAVTLACLLKACGSIKAVNKGEEIHEQIARQGLLDNDIVLGNALVDMYVKCGALEKAYCALKELPLRNVISWSVLIAGYAQHGKGVDALDCYEQMLHEGFFPDAVTYICILKACGTLKALRKGEQIHDESVKQGLLESDMVLGNALIDMYAKCGALDKAKHVLEQLPSRDVVSWSTLIAGYAQQGQSEQAIECLTQMQREGLTPNAVTFTSILKACGTEGAIGKGEEIHEHITKQGLLQGKPVLVTALVDMYAKCGVLAKAQEVLENHSCRDAVTWGALIAGYVQEGQGEQALLCYKRMWHEGLSPDAATYACILKACGSLGAIDIGKQLHEQIAKEGWMEMNLMLGNAVVDMYARCGVLSKAGEVLEHLASRDVVSWNSLIAGYGQHGQAKEALVCFDRMQQEGLSPDALTFSCVLNACCHLGRVEEGGLYFVNMSSKYGIKPDLDHFTCMVDLFGRAGHLDKAVRVIHEMPSSDYAAVWSALLSACQKWGDVNVGRWAFDQAVKVDKSIGAAYVLMANIYADAGMQQDVQSIEALRLANKALEEACK